MRNMRSYFAGHNPTSTMITGFIEAIDRALKPSRGNAPRKARRQAKREEWAVRIQAVRQAVLDRSRGDCESCGQLGSEMDEYFGGIGRRRILASLETCWMLCRACHHDKTANRPNARHWATIFRDHCLFYGYQAAAQLAFRRFAEPNAATDQGASK